jgi:hypothetical protein
MSSTGQPLDLDAHLLELARAVRPSIRYWTPADVRAIPNELWEQWHRDGINPCPWFAARGDTQMAMGYAMQAHRQRIKRG